MDANAFLTGLPAVVLATADLERATAFYRDVIGLDHLGGDDHSAAFDLGPSALIVMRVDALAHQLSVDEVSVPLERGPQSQLCCFVDDVDQSYHELAARGVTFLSEPTNQAWGRRTAIFRDLDGHCWELSQPV